MPIIPILQYASVDIIDPLLKLHLFSAGCRGGGGGGEYSIVSGAEWEGVRGVRWAGGGRGGEWWELTTSNAIKTACFRCEPASPSCRGREGGSGRKGGRRGGGGGGGGGGGERGGEVSLG